MAAVVPDMLFYLFSLVNLEVLGPWRALGPDFGAGTWIWCIYLFSLV